MEIIFFTKFLKPLNPSEIAVAVRELGADGLDLTVRNGYGVNPQNVTAALPEAMKVWRNAGLTVPLVTLEGNAVNPDDPQVRAIYAACGKEGIPHIKLGYWRWDGKESYRDGLSAVRNALEGFEALGKTHGICSLVHTHSGNCYGLNASSAMSLVQDRDPRYVGVYMDPAHLSLCGEPLPMALGIVKGYLKMVAVKNARREVGSGDSLGTRWRTVWTTLTEGFVNWHDAVRQLRAFGYEGVMSLHAEYSATEETREVLELAKRDLDCLQACLS